jgi:hypothetical protein
LAAAIRSWPEFVDGSGYDVDLEGPEEKISVRHHDTEEDPHILISSSSPGPLLERVIGLVTFALSAHSDYLMVYRCTETPIQPSEPTSGLAPGRGSS